MKNKNLIVTICCGDFYNKISEITHVNLKQYAKKCNADFIIFNEFKNHVNINYKKYELIEFFKNYEKILYIDTDIYVNPNANNIFHEFTSADIGMFKENNYVFYNNNKYLNGILGLGNYITNLNDKLKYTKIDIKKCLKNEYYNAGVILLNKKIDNFFNIPENIELNQYHFDQDLFNINIQKYNLNILNIGLKYNCPIRVFLNMSDSDKKNINFIHILDDNKLELIKQINSFFNENEKISLNNNIVNKNKKIELDIIKLMHGINPHKTKELNETKLSSNISANIKIIDRTTKFKKLNNCNMFKGFRKKI